jgi:hypothetical protein
LFRRVDTGLQDFQQSGGPHVSKPNSTPVRGRCSWNARGPGFYSGFALKKDPNTDGRKFWDSYDPGIERRRAIAIRPAEPRL